MKGILFFICFTGICTNLLSQTNFIDYRGYVIFQNNDSFFTKIRIDDKVKNIELSNLYNEVVYINKEKKPDTISPAHDDIIGYGFKKDTTQYNFHKLLLNQKNKSADKNPIFAWCIVDGPLKLYSYSYDITLDRFSLTKSLYQNANPNALLHEYTKNKRLKYFFQKTNEELKQVPENSDNSPEKKWLKSFFKNDESLCNKIGKEINIFDLETMAREYNSWYQQNQAINK